MKIHKTKHQSRIYHTFARLMILSATILFHSLLPTQVFGISAENTSYRAQNDVLYSTDCDASGSGGSSGGGGSTLPGDNNAARAFNYLTSHGYTPEQAAGIVGNMILESGVNPQRDQGSALNSQTPADQAKGPGWGIVQWTPPSKMINPTKAAGKDPNDLTVQLDYLTAGGNLNGGANADAADRVKATNTPEDATQAFGQYYEAPGDLSASIAQRKMYARAIYENSKGTPLPPQVEAAIYKGSGSSSQSSNPTSSAEPVANTSDNCSSAKTVEDNGECKDPFRDLKDSYPMRVDGGVDWGGDTGSGPVYAACPAEITLVQTSGSGWPGLGTESSGAYITYKVTSGKAKDKFIYISEDCTPKVAKGDKVGTDKAICDYRDQGTHLEIGWSEGGNNQYVSWSDYPGADNNFASNSGLDFGKFMKSLGGQEGVTKNSSGISTTPPPASWPKWGSSTINI